MDPGFVLTPRRVKKRALGAGTASSASQRLKIVADCDGRLDWTSASDGARIIVIHVCLWMSNLAIAPLVTVPA
jgi:hypothetical protein